MSIEFKQIEYNDTKPFLLHKHYAHRMPSISYAYGLFQDDVLHGVLTYGIPASRALVVGIAGEQNAKHVIELNRLYIDDEISQNVKSITSKFVSWTLKQLKPYNKLVVSYADAGMNHVGYIYQATNFYYTGETKSRTDRYSGHGKHSRHYDKDAIQKYRVFRSPKYRYIYFACDKRCKKQLMKDLNYPIIDKYPKGGIPIEHYNVGDTKPEWLKDMATGKKFKYVPS